MLGVANADQDVDTSNGHSKEVDPHSADVRINFYYFDQIIFYL